MGDYTCCICATIGLSLLLLALYFLWPKGIDCVSGRESWQVSWSPTKQAYCCRTTGFGCMVSTTPPFVNPGPVDPYNCADGFDNWVKAWANGKKSWCCQNFRIGCPEDAALNAGQASQGGYGAGAKYGTRGAGVASITGIVPYASTHGR